MAQAISRENLGAWLLKCNPELWDLRGFIRSGEGRITSWAVQRNYRSDLMARADRVLFWVSGSGSSGLARGIWGAGHVVAPAEDWSDDDRGFWIRDQPRRAVRGRVPVDIATLRRAGDRSPTSERGASPTSRCRRSRRAPTPHG